MKVLGKRVLIEQTLTKKESKIIMAGKNNEDSFNTSYKVLALGPECPTDEIKIGDIPIFGKYGEPQSIKILEKSEEKMIAHIIVPYDDIIGIED